MPACLDERGTDPGDAGRPIGEKRPPDHPHNGPPRAGKALQPQHIAVELPGGCPVLVAVVFHDHPSQPVDQVRPAQESTLGIAHVDVDVGLGKPRVHDGEPQQRFRT